MIKLQVLITKKLYYGNSWGIYGCETVNPNDRKLVKLNTYGNFTIKGNMYDELIEGRKYVIEIEDEIEKSSRGESYNIIKVHIPKLTSSETQYDFLATIVTETQYQNIVKKFPPKSKLKIIDAIRNDEIDLTTVYGIGIPTAEKIKTTVIEKEELIHLFNKLTPLGVKPNTINKIVEHYKTPQRALNKINESLYNLCEVKGLGFITVDKYALEGGEQVDGFKRMEACVNYLVHEFAKEGHSWTSIEEMKVEANKLLNIDSYHLDVFLGSLDLQDSEETNLLDVFNGQITNKYYYKIEKEVYENLHRINDNYKNISSDNDIEKAIDIAQTKLNVSFSEEQNHAITKSFSHGVSIINGKGGTGKCVHGDSLVFTDKGLLKIKDIPKYYSVNNRNESEASIVSYDTDGNKEILHTSHFYNMGLSKTYKIKTKQGYEIEGTPEHPILIVNDDGDLEFKQLQHFSGKEVIPISINNQLFGDNNLVNEDIAYFMGLLTGDGSTNGINYKTPHWSLILTNSVKEIGEEFKRISKDEFDINVNASVDGNTFNYGFNSREKVLYLKYVLKLSCCISKDKKIPDTIMTAPKSVIKAFIQGLFDTDGSVTGNTIEFSTASETMAKQLHVMLLNFGVVTRLRTKYVKGYEQPYFIITTSSRSNIKKFYEEIGFKNEYSKQSKLKQLTENTTKQNDNLNILTNMNDKIYDIHKYLIQQNIPTYRKKYKYRLPMADGSTRSLHSARELVFNNDGKRKSCSSKLVNDVLHNIKHMNEVPNFNYLMNITENMFIDYVDTIEESKAVVYDFTVPKNHSFVANGIINHNTTIMKGITEACDALGLSYKAVSLSGRAAQLLTLKGIEASTIHRLLGYKGKSFMHNEEFPLSQDVIILEEASMDNVYLWHSVLIAMKDGAKLIIVGDSGQLPAIGNGDVLRDLINNPMFKKFELQQIHRQAQDSGIIEVAGKIREGENITGYNWELSNSYGVNEDLFIFTFNNREVLHNKAKGIITKQMNKLDSDTIMDFQILVANKSRGELSAVSINNLCQSIYNDLSKESVKNYVYEFRVDDKVIVSGNKYKVHMYNSISDYKKKNPIGEYDNLGDFIPDEHSLYNGTIGIIVSVDTSKDNYSCLVKFEGFDGYIKIEKEELKDLDLAYAITIHKSQGISISNTLFLLDQSAYKLLSRQLVYTAITRASKKCVVLAENNSLMKAISNDHSSHRRTFIGQFIQQES